MHKNSSSLQRKLSPISVWALAFGCIIGWGAFVNPGKRFLPNSGVAGTAIAMLLGAFVMIIIAFSYAFLVPKYPKAGGSFIFTKECFGKIPAFICGWFLLSAYLTNVPMNSTAIGLISDGLFGPILKFGFSYTIAGSEIWLGEILVSVLILIFFAFLNIIGVKKAGFVQTILASLLIVSVFTIFIAAFCSSKTSFSNLFPIWGFDEKGSTGQYTPSLDNQNIASSILATFAITPWAFVGFDTIPQAAEEVKFSYKKMIFIMIIAILFGCFVYVSNNTITAAVLKDWPDEVLAGNADLITIVLKKDGSISIQDNGRGIPTGINETTKLSTVDTVFTTLHAGGKFDDSAYHSAGGLHGVGSSVVNALSKWCNVTVYRSRKIWEAKYVNGGKIEQALKEVGNTNLTGTKVHFKPDDTIFKSIEFKPSIIKERVREATYLFKGLKVIFKDEINGTEDEYVANNGIVEYVDYINETKTPIHKTAYFKGESNKIAVDIALQYVNDSSETIVSFANSVKTKEGGSHETAFKTALTETINAYSRKNGLLKEKDKNFEGSDVREGLTSIVVVTRP